MAKEQRDDDQIQLDLQLPEGVHLDIPDDAYFNARAIGSSDLKTLYWQPESWWFASYLNPRRRMRIKAARKQALDLGHAMHDLVLLGDAAYRARFTFQPDEDDPRWIMTPVELKKELRAMGKNVDQVFGHKLNDLAKRAGIANRVWDIAWASYETAKKAGKPYMTEDDDVRVRHTAGLILEHPALGHALRGPAGLSEVAVFWRRDDDPETLLRAKFDRIALQRMFDLKTLGNWRGRDIDAAIADAIDSMDYGIQRRFYHEAFLKLIEFVKAGEVRAWSEDGRDFGRPRGGDLDLLKSIASGGPAEWIWVFVQIRNDTVGQERAPMIVPRFHKPAGRIWDEAGVKIETALSSYRRLRSAHGLNSPWSFIDDAKELKDSDIRSRTKRELS